MRTRSRSARAAEIEGFLIGIERRLQTEGSPNAPDPEAARLAREARTALAAGKAGTAEELLEAAGARLDALRPEPRLREWPRDLVEYVPKGRAESDGSVEEDALFNRLLLVQRLLTVRASQGAEVAGLVRRLRSAEEAFRRGDRARARQLVDEVHDAIDPGRRPPSDPPA